MATSALNLYSGGQLVNYDELKEVKTPQPVGRWWPIGHSTVLDVVKTTLSGAGFVIRDQKLALDKNGNRFFGTLDLATPLAEGVSLCVGVRNSIDRSMSQGFVAGNRVFVCSNMSFRSELLVSKRHTKHGQLRFGEAIADAVTALTLFKETEAHRVKVLMTTEITDERADALLLRSFEKGVIGARQLPLVIKEWREPSFEDFRPRTYWSLLNAVTTVLGKKLPAAKQAALTMRLNNLVETPLAIAA